MKFDGALSAYLTAQKATGVAPQTISTAGRDLETFRRFLRFSQREHMDLSALSSAELREYLRFLRTHPTLFNNRPMGRHSAVERFGRFRHFLKFLHAEDITARNLALGAGYYTLDLTDSKCLNVAEVVEFMAGPDVSTPMGVRDRALLELMYGCALRWKELVALECGDVDDEMISVRDGDRSASKRIDFDGTLARSIPVPSEARAWLTRYLEEVRPRIVEEKGCRSDSLFLGFINGRPLLGGAIFARVENARKRTSIAKAAACSSLRNALIHHLLSSGVDEETVWWFAGLAPLPENANPKMFTRAVLERHPRHKL